MGIRLLRGRHFTAADTAAAPRVVIVDDSLAAKLFPSGDPIGKRITFEMHRADHGVTNPVMVWREIVGVVAHVKHYGIASEPPYVQLYTPFEQLPTYYEQRRPTMALFARTSLSPETLTAAIRREAAALDPDVPVYAVQTMTTYVRQHTEQPRLSVFLLGGLGALALVLAVIGIYGVVSYSVTERTAEFGVRMALGATRADVLKMVAGQVGALIGAGLALGVVASLALGSAMEKLLFQVSPRDPLTMAAIGVVLGVVALAAGLVPARRATRVDPLVALRAE
jgi:predicted permease